MKQSNGQKKRAWFLVGVVLLSISALWWLLTILAVVGVVGEPQDTGWEILPGVTFTDAVDAFFLGLFLTAIPVGLGIYCVRRGMKAPAAAPQERSWVATKKKRATIKETETQIVIRPLRWLFVGGCLILLLGVPTLFAGLGILWGFLTDPPDTPMIEWVSVAFLLIIPGLALVWWGVSLVGRRTKVTFNRPLGYMTVTPGHISLLLWSLRTKRISSKEARTAHFHVDKRGSTRMYQVKIVMSSGEELTLHDENWEGDKADYLARRIREFGREV